MPTGLVKILTTLHGLGRRVATASRLIVTLVSRSGYCAACLMVAFYSPRATATIPVTRV